ncbi:MAG: pyrroline-5-carboxylate reductase [Aeromicrobium sp.]
MVTRIAILGGGVMGETLLTTLVAAGQDPATIAVAEKSGERAEALRTTHGVEVTDGAAAVKGADLVLLVVKPQDVPQVLADIAADVSPGATVASFAAGVRIAQIEAALAPGTAVIRIMPNTPAVVGEGMFGASPGSSCSAEDVGTLERLLSAGGRFIVIDESLQDALTAVSGSGPAYVFYLAEAMIAGGVEAGLDAETARVLTTQTILGAAKLLADSDADAAELRRRVTSPNGTTAEAIATFDERGVKAAIAAGVQAAARRSAELSGA